jgi:[glutamine synthetase] adenylyltransferase / [glutamine synthetase]-adenylyl-L-tyrosine phosphorylase
MEPELSGLIDALARGDLSEQALAQLGEPEPRSALQALIAAAHEPALRPHLARWGAPLLLSARPGFGAQVLAEIARRYRATRGAELPPDALPSLAAVVGNSDFLARLLQRHPHWCEELRGDPPAPPAGESIEPDWTAIRIAKYQGLLRIAARDLAERPFSESLSELSELADRCLVAGLERAALETEAPAPALFALGKLGGHELNFSSDVDLLFVYGAPAAADDLTLNARTARLIQLFKRQLEARSEDGLAYRVDLDLRPEGRQGALANSVDAALYYYETFGAEWERQALIRLRYLGGPREEAERFTAGIEPFVFRRGIDLGAIRRVREMKQRIEQERRDAGRDIEHDLKEGPGGIRDVEFLVQALQLFHGGRSADLRTGNVERALAGLARHGLLPESAATLLRDGYLWLRRAEHAVQMVEERQTQRFPREAAAQLTLARRMGYRDEHGTRARDRLLDDWTRVRAQVRQHFENLVLGGEA